MSLREQDDSAHASSRSHTPHITRRQARDADGSRTTKSMSPSRSRLPRVPVRQPVMRRTPKLSSARPPRTPSTLPRKLLSIGALLFAGALLVGTSVPANAFLTDPALVSASTTAPMERDGQTVEVSEEAVAAATVRDGYEVITYAQQLREKYANVSYTFSATTGAVRWPFPYPVTITDGFGPRSINVSGTSFHNGVDFTPGDGTPIYAIADGVVTGHSEDQGGFGNHVILQHEINGQKVESVYAHMQYGSSPLVVGETLAVGDFIGLVGNTGTSYGAHLHFEVRLDGVAVDPFEWLTNNAVN